MTVAAGPTPETLAKLEPDQIQELYESEMIDSAGLRAADQIARVYSEVTRESGIKSPTLGTIHIGKHEMPADIAVLFTKVYNPWRASLDPVVAGFVVQVAVRRTGMKNDVDRMVVAQSLMQYARRM